MKFSPDGTKVAVGFHDSTIVNVLSVPRFSLLYEPDTSDVTSPLIAVAWSIDGQFLYAGGQYSDEKGNSPIRIWTDAGRGSWTDHPVTRNTLGTIVALNDGGVAYGAADPAFGVLAPNGARTIFRNSLIVEYAHNLFSVSYDGMVIQFSYWRSGWKTARFTIPARSFDLNPPDDSLVHLPLKEAKDLSITDWKYTFAPKLNGRLLPLDNHERSRSLAIAPDQQSFVLGTSWALRSFDRLGQERWATYVSSTVNSVNISRDGRFWWPP